MSHAAEGQLLAYLDGELEGAAAADLSAHLDECARCRAELDELRSSAMALTGALTALDRPFAADVSELAWRRLRSHRLESRPKTHALRFHHGDGMRMLARAAVLLLVLAGVVSAAIPGSPLRRAVERLLGPASPPTPAVTTSSAPAPSPEAASRPVELPGVILVPSDGGVRVLVWQAHAGATVQVNLVDGTRVSVRAGSDAEDVRFRTGRGRIEVMDLGGASAIIDIPRSLSFASVEVDGRQWLFKDGDQLRVTGPVVQQGRHGVMFRVAN